MVYFKITLLSVLENSFKGIYNKNIQYHEGDLPEVLLRAHKAGVDKMIIKGFLFDSQIFNFKGRSYE